MTRAPWATISPSWPGGRILPSGSMIIDDDVVHRPADGAQALQLLLALLGRARLGSVVVGAEERQRRGALGLAVGVHQAAAEDLDGARTTSYGIGAAP